MKTIGYIFAGLCAYFAANVAGALLDTLPFYLSFGAICLCFVIVFWAVCRPMRTKRPVYQQIHKYR